MTGVQTCALPIFGYIPNAVQSVKAISAIRGLMFIYPSALAIATIVVMGLFYKLTDDKYREIIIDLNARRNTTAL